MSSGAAWAGLAGLAQGIGGVLKQRHDDQEEKEKEAEKEKLLQLQQDAMTKREQFLIDYKVGAEQKAKDADHERTQDDVVGTVTNPETGEQLGRTKSGLTVPLVSTSDAFQKAKAAKLAAQVANTSALATNRQAANKGPTNPNYGTGQPAPDPSAAAQQQQSPSQPQAPTPDQIIAEANAAIKRGAPQAAVEAKMQQLMQQYGYQPQAQ